MSLQNCGRWEALRCLACQPVHIPFPSAGRRRRAADHAPPRVRSCARSRGSPTGNEEGYPGRRTALNKGVQLAEDQNATGLDPTRPGVEFFVKGASGLGLPHGVGHGRGDYLTCYAGMAVHNSIFEAQFVAT